MKKIGESNQYSLTKLHLFDAIFQQEMSLKKKTPVDSHEGRSWIVFWGVSSLSYVPKVTVPLLWCVRWHLFDTPRLSHMELQTIMLWHCWYIARFASIVWLSFSSSNCIYGGNTQCFEKSRQENKTWVGCREKAWSTEAPGSLHGLVAIVMQMFLYLNVYVSSGVVYLCRIYHRNGHIYSIGSDNGLVPNKRQAIICSNFVVFYWLIYASLGLHESSSRFVIHEDYIRTPGGRLNKKDGLTRYGDSHVKDKTS